MIVDETPPLLPEVESTSPSLKPANANGGAATAAIDPRILIIAGAIGRQIAQEHLDKLQATNDNMPKDGQ